MTRLQSDRRHHIRFTLNGSAAHGKAEPRMLLTDFLRHQIGATGTHVGCEQGVCGACTVVVDGMITRACLMLAVQIDGSEVRTVEGLAPSQDRLGVLQSACQEAGMPTASLWASVPHYVAAAPNPKAALALVRKLESLLGVAVDATELETASTEYERQVSLAVQSDPDVQAFVERLEQAAEEDAADQLPDPRDLPSGDVLAREFQRFLRQRGPEET